MSFVALAIGGSALLGAGVSLYEGSQANKAISQEQNLLNNLQYEPINIQQLQQQATAASIADATNSLALQRSLQPAVAQSNAELQSSVAKQLALGGNLNADTLNQVEQAGRTAGSISGATGNAAPLTSALIGQNSINLLQQRQNAATALSAANPAPTVGLSAQDIASATEANNNALNQFNLAKAGAQSNLINSGAQSSAATAGGIGGSLSSAAALLALLSKGGSSTATPTLGTGVPSSFSGTSPNLVGGSALLFPTASGSINPGGS